MYLIGYIRILNFNLWIGLIQHSTKSWLIAGVSSQSLPQTRPLMSSVLGSESLLSLEAEVTGDCPGRARLS